LIAVDTNILVYSVREDSPWHSPALACVRQLAEGEPLWAIPWPCIHEFVSVVTHPRIYKPPMVLGDALRQVNWWMASPSLRLIGERENYWDQLVTIAIEGKAIGPAIHDARIAAICATHGVSELWSVDRDFRHFPNFRVRNPFAAKAG
jgi:toxin-antitoxin system PIN domain toxin